MKIYKRRDSSLNDENFHAFLGHIFIPDVMKFNTAFGEQYCYWCNMTNLQDEKLKRIISR